MEPSKIAEIAAVMESHGLSRVRLEEADGSAVELERGGAAPAAAPVAPAPAAPAPGAEPFVHVGSKVKKGETLCVIEAMKVMNEVTAEADGEIVDICVKDGELVEYGCCLMKIY